MKIRNYYQYLFLTALLSLIGTNVYASGIAFASCDTRFENITEVNDDEVTIEELKAVVKKATEDGDSWTEEEWKKAYKTVVKAIKPLLLELKDMQEKIEGASEEEQMKIVSELTEKLESYKEISDQFEAFEKVAESSEIGKRLSEDEEFQKEIEKELGLGEGFFDDL